MKKITKAFTMTVTAAAVLLFVLLPGTALGQSPVSVDPPAGTPVSREEVVYVNLTAAGVTKDIYIVSALRSAEAGTVTGYGNYASVKNLTDTGPVTLIDDQVTFSAPKGDFYYQGTLKSTDLPWRIDVTYELDGTELPADALAGKSGHVKISIKTTRNDAVDPVYFENYLLQLSVTLDTSKCANITAPGGTLANAGINKLVAFTVMPVKEGDMTVETDASDFSMNGIEFSAVPLSMQFDPPDTGSIKDDLSQLTDAVSELNDGVAQLESGARELKNGAGDLSSGSSSFASGLRELNGSAAGLYGGSAQIKDALDTIVGSMSGAPTADGFDITGLLQLPDGLLQLAAGIDGISSGLSELKAGFAASYGALKSAILEIPDAVITEAELGQLYQVNPAMKDTLDKLAAYYAAGVKTKAVYANVRPLFDSMDAALDQLSGSADQISSALKDTAAQIKGALENSDAFNQLGQLSAGLQALSAKYGDFHEGLMMFTGGISKLNKNYGSLDGGISGLADGADALSDGLGQAADGVSALNDGVKDLPQKTDKEIQKLMDDYDKSDVKPVSFASPKNLNTASVQFVMKTDKIEKPEPPATAPEPVHKETIWDRFISLFK